jgi:hypothetical protein
MSARPSAGTKLASAAEAAIVSRMIVATQHDEWPSLSVEISDKSGHA